MRLIHLAHYGGPYPGSFIPMLRAVLRAGHSAGYDVEAVFDHTASEREWLAELEADGIPYRFATAGSAGAVDGLLAGAPVGQPCVLHSHFSSFDLACARRSRANAETVAFWHVHTPLHAGPKAFARNAVKYRMLSRGVNGILCVAPQLADEVRRRLGPRDRVQFFANAIDASRFPPADEAERRSSRERLGLPAEGLVLMHFGWDWERKGGDVYLRAVQRLTAAGTAATAVTVGGGERARSLVFELGIEDHVRVLDPTDRVADLYAAADLMVMPSRAEGMPFAMAESLAVGTPVVATDAAGERYIGASLAACRLVQPEPAAVAEAARALLARDPDSVRRDAAAARAWIEENMDLDAWAARLLSRYDAALGRGSG